MDGIGNGRERGNVGCGSRAKLSRSMVLFRPVKRRYSSADWTEPRNIWRKLARRMKISLALVVLSLFAINAAFAAPAATAPAADLSSPLGALRAYDQALPAGGIKAAISAYQASNPREQQAAEAMAQADLAGAQIELLARQKFGEKAAREVIHAMRQTSPADFDTAHVKLAGDKDHPLERRSRSAGDGESRWQMEGVGCRPAGRRSGFAAGSGGYESGHRQGISANGQGAGAGAICQRLSARARHQAAAV